MASGGGAGHWMEGAVKHPGALRTAAHRAGMSSHEYAESHKDAPGTAGRRARLALTFERFRRKGS
jgi:hypothetical protein